MVTVAAVFTRAVIVPVAATVEVNGALRLVGHESLECPGRLARVAVGPQVESEAHNPLPQNGTKQYEAEVGKYCSVLDTNPRVII